VTLASHTEVARRKFSAFQGPEVGPVPESNDEMPMQSLEASVRETGLVTKVRLGPQGPQATQGRDVPRPLFGALVPLGLTGGLGSGRSAFYAAPNRADAASDHQIT
jgi:hypothetical protein